MFSGKTTRLISGLQRYTIGGYKCLMVKYDKDQREYDTHDKTNRELNCEIVRCGRNDLNSILSVSNDYDVIGIDEAQFYPNIRDICVQLKDQGIIVLVSGLISTFELKMFESMTELLPHVDKLKKINAICPQCGNDGIYSIRTIQSDKLEVIGGIDEYIPLCRTCYLNK